MPRFVLLTHDWPVLHWDFMLEQGDSLLTWRLESEPVCNQWIPATPIAPHRLAYLDYEGPVSGGRGSVKRYANGVYELEGEWPREKWLRATGDQGERRIRILDCVDRMQVLFE